MNSDGVIDQQDLVRWLADAATVAGLPSSYGLGDGNLDGLVDISDFNIWNSHKFQLTGDWDEGDFNGDGIVDISDFNVWNTHKFTSAFAARSVPEPSGWMALLFVAIAVMRATPSGNAVKDLSS